MVTAALAALTALRRRAPRYGVVIRPVAPLREAT
jgi:hypothetical protein